MKLNYLFACLLLCSTAIGFSQEPNDAEENGYVEFNDRSNVVHGVYLGLTAGFGEIEDKDTFIGGVKVAYVANRQFEVGFVGNFLYSEQDVFNATNGNNEDLIGGYGGLHLEPILFGKSRVNLSFPLLIGAGGVGYVDRYVLQNDQDVNIDENDIAALFIFEPGVSVLFNINRYLQLEAGVKYRFSNTIKLVDSPIDRINGFTAGIGLKVGVFNLGRNRYKKSLDH